MLASPEPAKASDGELNALVQCLGARMETQAYASCIGLIANRCLAGASDNENALNRLSGMTECYKREQAAWQTLLSRAVAAWRRDNATPLVPAIEDAVARGRRFARAKCGVFQNVQQFGATGMVLSAECHAEESARMAISSATASTKEEGGQSAALNAIGRESAFQGRCELFKAVVPDTQVVDTVFGHLAVHKVNGLFRAAGFDDVFVQHPFHELHAVGFGLTWLSNNPRMRCVCFCHGRFSFC
ncbi:hypothetical protein [Hoeflea sp. EC-HK425]|uniref:hypothetical protein n=1 Tax=Hoeflea sp. EC-HK425 TaxID=2038388 RepID=UPI00125F5D2B|nr:hypothetical protein [Hoeflea sp. EC-HK425]